MTSYNNQLHDLILIYSNRILFVSYINYILGASKEYNNIPLKYLFD